MKYNTKFIPHSLNLFCWATDDIDKYYDDVSVSMNDTIVGYLSCISIAASRTPAPIYTIPGKSYNPKDSLTGDYCGSLIFSEFDRDLLYKCSVKYHDYSDEIPYYPDQLPILTINLNKNNKIINTINVELISYCNDIMDNILNHNQVTFISEKN